jgi:hypothetical protein
MSLISGFSLCLVACGAGGSSENDPSTQPSAGKKLIQSGWGEPETEFVKNNIKSMEEQPFDGLVFNIRYADPQGSLKLFSFQSFGPEIVPEAGINAGIKNIKATLFSRFTDNFLRFNLRPGGVEWFDDMSAPLANASSAGRFVKETGITGVYLDVEPYDDALFKYSSRKYAENKSFDEYAAKVKEVASKFIQNMEKEAPGLTIFLSFGYEMIPKESADKKSHRYGLLKPFLDGLLEGSSSAIFVNGYEGSYAFSEEKEFNWAYSLMKDNAILSSSPEAYRARLQAAFGLWVDLESNSHGWYPDNVAKNKFSPERFQAAVIKGLRRTDRYVWIYSQKPQWWTKKDLPPEYVWALRRARKATSLPE